MKMQYHVKAYHGLGRSFARTRFISASTALFITFAAIGFVNNAQAETGRVDQVEQLDGEAGEFELESQNIWVPKYDGEASQLAMGLTFEYGLLDNFIIGTEAEFEREDGENFGLSEFAAQAKWIALSPQENAVGLGIQSSIIYNFEDDALSTETFFIAAIDGKEWTAAANIIASSEAGNLGKFDLGYSARADKEIGKNMQLGMEIGGDIAVDDPKAHWMGPVISFEPIEKGPELEISAFTGLNQNSPDVQFRLEIDWEF
ncbi:hypothetical protein [Sphingorhabdus lutea]|nr:hypothetical protein [Sphingorhabdus lutea]